MGTAACMSLSAAAESVPDADGCAIPAASRGDEQVMSVQSQLAVARTAQADWQARSVRDRLKVLKELRLKVAADPLALAIRVERDDHAETLAAEVLPLLDACRYLETEAARILKEKTAGHRGRPFWLWGNTVVVRREPLGVVLIIGPSNYPLMLPGIQALQALAAGNAVLIKPAENCSAAAESLTALAESAGLPAGLIQVLPESPEAAGSAIRAGVDKVFLTGSAVTGRIVRQELADSGTPSVMELSGCDAVFLLQDADLNLVSDCLVFGLRMNNSQTCMAPRRVFLTSRQSDELLPLLKSKLTAAIRGPETASDRRAGLQVHRQASIAARKVGEAVDQGAVLAYGVRTETGHVDFSSPVVLDQVTSEMSVARSDLFVPLLSLIRVESEDEALRENSKCPYALSATVFGSAERCQQFARRIPAGCIIINDMIAPSADPRVAFGGRAMSGYGMTRGEIGLLEMTHAKTVITARRWFKPHLRQRTPADASVLENLIRLEHAAGPLQSLMTLPKMIRATLEQIKALRSSRVQGGCK